MPITVLPADDPKKLKLGQMIYEYVREWLWRRHDCLTIENMRNDPNNKDGLVFTGPDYHKMFELKNLNDIKVGMKLHVLETI